MDSSIESDGYSNIYYNDNESTLIQRLCMGNGATVKYDHPTSSARYCYSGAYCNAQCSFYQNILGQPQILRPTAALLPYRPSESNGPWEFKAFGDTVNDLVFLIQDSTVRSLKTTNGGTWASLTGADNDLAIPTGGISATLVNDYYIGAEDASSGLKYLQFTTTTLTSIGGTLATHPDLRGNPYIYYWSS